MKTTANAVRVLCEIEGVKLLEGLEVLILKDARGACGELRTVGTRHGSTEGAQVQTPLFILFVPLRTVPSTRQQPLARMSSSMMNQATLPRLYFAWALMLT